MGKQNTDAQAAASDHPAAVDGSLAHLPLGRVAPRHDPRTLKLARYIDDAVLLPEIPETFDLAPKVDAWPVYGNDRLGDCTIATVGHMIQAWYALAGKTVTPEEAAIIAAYWATGDGSGSDDTGRFEVDVLNYWRNTGVAGDKILAYAYVDPQNLDHVRAALYLFGGLYTGQGLPKTAQTQPVWDVVGDGKTGDSQPGSWGGHAVPYLPRWDGSTVPLVTWGHVLDATVPFHLAYCDELYAVISTDFLNEAEQTPAGFDLAALQADLDAITGAAAAPKADEPDPADAGEADRQVEELHGTPEPVAPDADDGYYWNG